MNSHPDADGFVRSILANPSDPTPRLVFADWLDDTGRPGNTAWAEYIRARVEYDEITTEVERYLRSVAERIEARLTLPAEGLSHRLPHLFELLPPYLFTVRLSDFRPRTPLTAFMPEAVARNRLVFPVWMDAHGFAGSRCLVLATDRPTDHPFAVRLSHTFRRDIYLVAADMDDVVDAINRVFGDADRLFADSPPLVLPGNGSEFYPR